MEKILIEMGERYKNSKKLSEEFLRISSIIAMIFNLILCQWKPELAETQVSALISIMGFSLISLIFYRRVWKKEADSSYVASEVVMILFCLICLVRFYIL